MGLARQRVAILKLDVIPQPPRHFMRGKFRGCRDLLARHDGSSGAKVAKVDPDTAYNACGMTILENVAVSG